MKLKKWLSGILAMILILALVIPSGSMASAAETETMGRSESYEETTDTESEEGSDDSVAGEDSQTAYSGDVKESLKETAESVETDDTVELTEVTADKESEETFQSIGDTAANTNEDSKETQDSFETDDTSEVTGQSDTVQDKDTENESVGETIETDSENVQTDTETEDTELLETDESQSETQTETKAESYSEEDMISNLPEMIANSIQAGIPQVMSLLPLEETKAYLILNDYSEEDLKQVPLETILNNLQYSDGTPVYIDPESKIVWTYFKDEAGNIIQDEYHEIGRNEIVDLSQFQNSTGYTLELIVGNGKQLDPNNKRYIITVYISDKYSEKLEFEIYSQNLDSTREKIPVLQKQMVTGDSNIMSSSGTYIPLWGYYYVCPEGVYLEPYISVSSLLDQRPDVDVVIYELEEYKENMQCGYEKYPPVTDKLLNQDMSVADSGYKIDRTTDSGAGEVFIFLYYINGIQLDSIIVEFIFGGQLSNLEGDIFDIQDSNRISVVYQTNYNFGEIDADVDVYEYILKQEYSANKEYYFAFNAISGTSGNVNEHITKVVEGHYNSLAEASNLPDIKDLLLGDDAEGYKKDYSNGVDFTIFFDDSVFGISDAYQFTIKTKEYNDVWMDYTDAPIVGAQDPWFRVTGASTPSGGTLDTYVVENGKEINMDTMYGYGYQTIFINTKNEKEEISAIVPTFDMADSENVKVTSIHINDGQSYNIGEAIPCPTDETTVTFHVTIEDENGEHTKNYNVSFIKRSSGPKLYVTDPKGDNGVRSVFLDEYFEYKHDIFIANMGSEPLTGLRVELNATHVKLDDYWTIGGDGNDTLAPFDTTAVTTEYGELPNIAKIRLLPDGEGEIEGTVTIYADGRQEPVTIQLSGRAMNPEIITSSVEDAVKFVPYSYMISTNNMYDWTDVTFTMEGELPEGVEFIESTGEIYGVPRETGEFPLSVTAEFTSDTYDFEPSTIEFTLTVKDNSNENVYNATDDQYQILDPIGEDVDGNYDFVLTETGDQMFVSNGEFDEFVDLWLNGEKLIEGQDYTKEAGSTRITIQSQTFEDKANSDGSNTIAAEFRVDGDSNNELRRTAQNFRLDIQQEPSTGGQPSTDETQRPAETNTPSTDRPPVQDETQRPTETITPSTDRPPVQDETQRPADTDTPSTSAPSTDQRPAGDENPDVDDTQANGSTGNSDGDANANTSANTNTNANAGESGSESYNSGAQSDSDNTVRYVSFNVELVDEENVPLEDYIVEVHSQPQSTRTDSHGNAVFSKVEFGSHTLIVKDGDSNTLASKDFELRSGNSVSISGTIITAAGGSDVTLKVRLEDGQLVFLNATASVAKTGDTMMPMLWIGICLVSGLAVLGCSVYITKKRRYRR